MVDLFKSLENKLKQKNISSIHEAINLQNEVKILSESNPLDCWKKLWDKPLYSGVRSAPSHSGKWINQLINLGINEEFKDFINESKFKVTKLQNDFIFHGELGEKINRAKLEKKLTVPKKRVYSIYAAAKMLNNRMQVNENFPFFDITGDIDKLEDNINTLLSELRSNNIRAGWGAITVCHFLTDFGSAIKPDFHVCRALKKMNLFLTKNKLPDFEEVIAINKIVYDLNKKLGDSYSIRYVEKLLMEFSRQKLFET